MPSPDLASGPATLRSGAPENQHPKPLSGESGVTTRAVLFAAATFLILILAINHALFTSPIMEYWDSAVNAIQIERAKHFHEVLGNYSRWGFHHPGPAFFYLYAFGEWLLHDVLHIVPAAMNAHTLVIICLNTAFLFGSIGILAKRCRSRLFVPAAVALSLFFIHVVNRTIPGSAIFSIWPPHVLMFCFLFFVTVCTAVAFGELSKLWLLFLTGLLLIHCHAAQPLFVGTFWILTLLVFWFKHGRATGLGPLIKAHRSQLAISLGLCVLFALPIVADVLLNKPNNIEAILAYSAQHRGIQHSPGIALKYEVSFLDYISDTEVALDAKPTHIMSLGGSKPYVALYWCIGCLLLGGLIATYLKPDAIIPAFYKYLALEIAVVLVLFYIWTLKMGGPLLNFNGYFVYGMQLLALFIIAALILDGIHLNASPTLSYSLCVLVPFAMFFARPSFTNPFTGDPETNRLYDSIPADVGPVHFTFPAEYWTDIAGVANRMKHEARPFCVDGVWEMQFGKENVCRSMDSLTNLVLTNLAAEPNPRECNSPCRVLLHDKMFDFQLVPYPFFKLPFAVKPDEVLTFNLGFYGADEKLVWSSKKSTVFFRLDKDFTSALRVRVKVLGSALAGRPAQMILNGHTLGTINAGPLVTDYVVDRSWFVSGEVNQLTIAVDKAAPVGNDPRDLGFFWGGLELEPVEH